MSRLPLRGRLKAVAADFWQLLNSPSTRKDLIVHPSLMKTLPFALLVALVGAAAVRSQDAPVDPTRESGAAPRAAYPAMPAAILPTTARILGEIPDGTPPPPAPPKPKFIIPKTAILEAATLRQGGRAITIQKIKPMALPPLPETDAAPSEVDIAAFKARVAAHRAMYPSKELICAGATVYRSKTSPARSLVRIWPNVDNEPVEFWASADFGYLSGCPSFVGSDGNARSLFLMWTNADMDRDARSKAMRGLAYHPPEIPEFPAGPASYAFVGKLPSDRIIASVQSLHDIYNNEFSRLKTAFEGRQRANLQREADLKAHPPQPKDIVINYWRTEKPAAVKGAAK